jgi:amidase
VTTFIVRLSESGIGDQPPAAGRSSRPHPRLAVKDLIDIEGLPTTAGSRAVADLAGPAGSDAACMAGARAADAVIVGKTNLVELAYGASGVNEWFGTPVNPLDPGLLPGGSSSGSAVAVGNGDADVAYGSDTGGSIRIPAAYCGIAGLKTTHGRIPLDGVWPLAPSLDTVGPMAADVSGLAVGMALLEPGFHVASAPAARLGRLRVADLAIDPRIDAATDAAVAASGLAVTELDLAGWRDSLRAFGTIFAVEAASANAALMADPVSRGKLNEGIRAELARGSEIPTDRLDRARDYQRAWRTRLADLLTSADLLVLPTAAVFAPPLEEAWQHNHTQCTAPLNLAGLPALALPVRSGHRLPASMQLIGPAGSEELLLATGAVIEAAAGYRQQG